MWPRQQCERDEWQADRQCLRPPIRFCRRTFPAALSYDPPQDVQRPYRGCHRRRKVSRNISAPSAATPHSAQRNIWGGLCSTSNVSNAHGPPSTSVSVTVCCPGASPGHDRQYDESGVAAAGELNYRIAIGVRAVHREVDFGRSAAGYKRERQAGAVKAKLGSGPRCLGFEARDARRR